MPNFLNPSSFVLTLDSQSYSGAEFTIQTMILPDVSVEGALLNYQQINVGRAGDKINFGTFEKVEFARVCQAKLKRLIRLI